MARGSRVGAVSGVGVGIVSFSIAENQALVDVVVLASVSRLTSN